MKDKDKYYDTDWTPEGWTKQEWQNVWQKLWTLSRKELKILTKKLGTFFIDRKIQEKASKADFIELIDDTVDKKELLIELDKLIAKKHTK
ncbi:MAG: hypothetical protein ABH887_01455 [bacterium]